METELAQLFLKEVKSQNELNKAVFELNKELSQQILEIKARLDALEAKKGL